MRARMRKPLTSKVLKSLAGRVSLRERRCDATGCISNPFIRYPSGDGRRSYCVKHPRGGRVAATLARVLLEELYSGSARSGGKGKVPLRQSWQSRGRGRRRRRGRRGAGQAAARRRRARQQHHHPPPGHHEITVRTRRATHAPERTVTAATRRLTASHAHATTFTFVVLVVVAYCPTPMKVGFHWSLRPPAQHRSRADQPSPAITPLTSYLLLLLLITLN
ncbi:unnamed protein product [Chrysodeixis includens]|uniref:Uncharacterized protein n=1 Tax=Chrysodeixis includens TaxID=689277 RepID=A0A9N8KT88_CHRIL|nr:unnamed protein product [Chrysodeixis includens]